MIIIRAGLPIDHQKKIRIRKNRHPIRATKQGSIAFVRMPDIMVAMQAIPGIGAAADEYTPWRATKFYVPLLIQALSQSLTYPLVAAKDVASGASRETNLSMEGN